MWTGKLAAFPGLGRRSGPHEKAGYWLLGCNSLPAPAAPSPDLLARDMALALSAAGILGSAKPPPKPRALLHQLSPPAGLDLGWGEALHILHTHKTRKCFNCKTNLREGRAGLR